jgi:tryptophanyl-tRNA synthetase
MTLDLASAPAPSRAPLAGEAPRPRTFSGIQPSGIVHLGNDLGAIRNYVALAEQYEAIYCIVDYHALTSTHDADVLRARTREMAAGLLALGLNPDRCTLFVQSHRPEHTELMWLLATVTPVSWLERTPTYKEKVEQQPHDVNHGLLTYPVLQAADIVAPVVLGTDGVRKMSKSLGNTIDILGEPDLIRRQVMSMVTDTQRIKRTDPGRPEVCNVCQLQRFFGDDYEDLWEGERTARTGCVDMKKVLAERIVRHYAPARERYGELMAHPAEVDGILEAGADRLAPMAKATMDEVRERMGLR